jgi:hypothetical protein
MLLADPSVSELHGRVIFVLAPPHSGAEAVVRVLATAPGVVAAPAPSRLFETAVPRLVGNYGLGGGFGLSALVDPQSFLGAVRRLTDSVLAGVTRDQRLVEYSPGHVQQVSLLAAVYPDAHLVRVTRDPRAVAADAGWRRALGSARMWAAAHNRMLGALAFSQMTTIRVEDLADPTAVEALLRSLQLEPGPDTVPTAQRVAPRSRSLPLPMRLGVEALAGDLLVTFGYATGVEQ